MCSDNQRVEYLKLCKQRVKHQPKEKLFFAKRSDTIDFRSTGYRVSTCCSQQTFVSGFDHCRELIIQACFPAQLLETSTSSCVSLKTLLVLSHVCIFRQSHVHLDEASVSRLHHCQKQWVASNQSVGGRLGNQPSTLSSRPLHLCVFSRSEMKYQLARGSPPLCEKKKKRHEYNETNNCLIVPRSSDYPERKLISILSMHIDSISGQCFRIVSSPETSLGAFLKLSKKKAYIIWFIKSPDTKSTLVSTASW